MKNKLKMLIVILTIISLLITLPVSGDMLRTKAPAITIKNITDISVILFQNEKYIMPNKVKAQMSNGKLADTVVTWNTKSISTSKLGEYTSLGTVKGYSKKVKLTVKVLAPIKSIENINLSARQTDNIVLPNTINAVLTDGTKKLVDVVWSKKLDTSKVGSYDIEGIVKGFKDKVKATITVRPRIVTIEKIEEEIKLGSNYALPKKVEVILSDNSREYLDVKWNKQKVDTSYEGSTVVEGSIGGYSGKVYLVVNVKQSSVKDIAKESSKVLLLYIYDKHGFKIASGSGFVVSEDGKILTNFHVVDGASKIKAVDNNGNYIDIKGIYYYNEEQDLALLQLDSSNKFPYVKLGDSDSLQLGEQVVAIGSPKGLQNSISEGIVSRIKKGFRDGYTDIQVSAAISSGSSGGALFNMKGEVVGITYAKLDNAENVNFAIPINEAKAIMNNINTLSPISTIEKYDEKTAYVGFENFLYEKYTKLYIKDTKVNIDGFSVREADNGKALEILMFISDENGDYADYQKAMKQNTPRLKEEAKIDVQQYIYLPLKDGVESFKDKDVYLGVYSVVLFDKQPSTGDWDDVQFNEELGKWVGYDLEVVCTEQDGEYHYKWMQEY